MSIPAGTRIGHYEVLSLLGSGGMGEVYLAEDTRLGRRVALKLLPPRFTSDQERLRRFQQEARAASALNHPNIITIYEIGETAEMHFIAAEYVEGETLGQRLAAGRLDVSEALEIAIQVASALLAAHRAGIVHRDIKADNIMLRPDGYVKVLDFGLAKLVETFPSGDNVDPEAATRPLNATSPGVIMGTVNYMSPEQARGFKVDTRSDLFSLGVVLYEMISGRLPFTGNSGSDVIAAILYQEAAPLTRWRRDLPSDLEWIVAKMLAKERSERFQSADEVISVLKRVKQQLDFQAEQSRANQPTLFGESAPLIDPAEERRLSAGRGREKWSEKDELSAKSDGRVRSYDTNRLDFIGRLASLRYIFSALRGYWREALFIVAILVLSAGGAIYYWRESRATIIDAIAVIPFASQDAEANAEALAEGVSRGVIKNLSRLPRLRVRPFHSVLRFKTSGQNAPPDPRQIGRELDVPVIVTGRVAERSNGLQIIVELIDTRDNSYIWGRQYDRRRSDLLALDEEITRDLSQQLKLKLDGKEKAKLEALQYYLRGRYFWNKRTAADLRQGIESFSRAIELDSNFALAYAGLADSYNMLGTYGAMPPSEAFPRAREAAERALSIDDRLAEAHTPLAYVKHRYEWDWVGAEREFKRAIELDPNYAPAHQWYASLLIASGRMQEAIAEARRSQDLDPLSLIVNLQLAWVFYLSRQPEQALEQSLKILAIDENYFPGLRYAGLAYEQAGRYEEAIKALNKARDLSGGSPIILGALAHAHAVTKNRAEAQKLLDELLSVAPPRRVSTYEVAIIYAGMGEIEKAFKWLEQAFDERNDYLNYLMIDPRLDPLRSDPRYEAMLRRIGLRPNQA